ncbi:MAG: hypothetical protein ACYCX3_03260 [Thermoleophilia bacterium]
MKNDRSHALNPACIGFVTAALHLRIGRLAGADHPGHAPWALTFSGAQDHVRRGWGTSKLMHGHQRPGSYIHDLLPSEPAIDPPPQRELLGVSGHPDSNPQGVLLPPGVFDCSGGPRPG